MEASTSSAHAKRALITYYAPNNRVFDRVFKDQTLEQTRAEVRQKLNLPPEAEFRLAQLRDNMKDDFEAFRTQAQSSSSLHVEVSIEGETGGSTYVALQRMSSAAVTSGVMTISGRGMKKRKRHPNGFEKPNGQISTTSQFTPQAYLPQQPVIFPAPAYGHDSATPVPIEKSKSKKRKRRNSLEDQLPLPSQSIRGRSSGAMRPDLRVDGSPRMPSPPRKKKRAESLAPLPIPTSQERPFIDSNANSSGGIVPHRASKKHNHRDVSNSEELLGASGVSAPPLNFRAKEVLASSAKSRKKRRLEDIKTTDVPMQSPPPPSTPPDETPALVQTKKKKVRKSVESPNVPPSEEIQASPDDNLASTPSFTQPSSAIRAPVYTESSAKQKKKSKVPDTIPLASTDAILTRGVSEEVTEATGTAVSQERPRKKRSKTDAVTQPTEVVPSDANPDNVEILTEGQKKRRRKTGATQLELSVGDHATHPLTLSTPTIGHRRRQPETQAESKQKQKPKLIASSMEAANDDPFTITLVHTPHARPITAQKVPVAPKEKEKKSDLNVSSGPVASSTTLAADIASPDEDAAVDIRQKAKKSSKTRRGKNADMHVESGDVQPEEQTKTKRNSKKTKDKESTAQNVRTTPSLLGNSSDVVEKVLDLAQPSQSVAAPKGKSTRKRKAENATEGSDEAPKGI
ncbi:hypothetical protein PHLCEN_2v6952 [Hermanssonia centrifuga]|uniref:Uncharacterized protein n=1 Tax=Hermanssonia centrifuga TaxID=98765 RepID=A0A2R6NY07_9APHY|nr:hypothetical protein PHLCEN_2v6952 [Hermanssonia centrifuga]